jgi:hypothetical protein
VVTRSPIKRRYKYWSPLYEPTKKLKCGKTSLPNSPQSKSNSSPISFTLFF